MDKFFYCYNAMCQKVNSTSVFSFDPYFLAIKNLLLSELRQIAFYIQKLKEFNEDTSSYGDKVIKFISVLIVNFDFHRENFFTVVEDLYGNRIFLKNLYKKRCLENKTEPEILSSSEYELTNKQSILRVLNDMEKNINKENFNFSKNTKCIYEIMLGLVLNACNSLIELKRYGIDLTEEKNEVIKLLDVTNLASLTDEKKVKEVNDFARTDYKISISLTEEIIRKFGPVQKALVSRSRKKGKCILFAGGSLLDLEKILTTATKENINVYLTESSVNAFSYKKFAEFSNLTSLYDLKKDNLSFDFSSFPGPIFVSGASIAEISAIRGQIYTDAEYPPFGIAKIRNKDFSDLCEKAKSSAGFSEDYNSDLFETGYSQEEIDNLISEINNKFQNKEINKIIILSYFEKDDFINSYTDEFIGLLSEKDYVISFSHNLKRKNFKYFNTYNDFSLLYKIVSKLKENSLNTSTCLFLFELKNSTISAVFNFLYLEVKNVFIAHCCPDTVNSDLSKCLSELFDVKEITSPNEDIKLL